MLINAPAASGGPKLERLEHGGYCTLECLKDSHYKKKHIAGRNDVSCNKGQISVNNIVCVSNLIANIERKE